MLTFFTLIVFKELHAFKGSCTGNELMRKLGLTVWLIIAAIVVVDFLVRTLCFS